MKIAVLSSYTIRGIADDNYEWHFSEYTWEDDLFDETSQLYTFEPEIILVSMDADDFGLVLTHIQKISESFPKAQIFIHSFFRNKEQPISFLSEKKIEETRLMLSLYHRVRIFSNVEILDVYDAIGRLGDEAFDQRYYYLAKMCFTQKALDALRIQLRTAIKAKLGIRRKCLVLDLDNTLWGGLLADGVENLILADDGIGKAFYDFQKTILELSRSGIILTICSKNDEQQALDVINNHPYMLLREKDFAAWRINWKSKPVNIAELADELNIGQDSMVFLDDSIFERDAVTLCTGVCVPDLPTDPAHYSNFLCRLRYFETFELTDEDRKRNEMYVQERSRLQERENFGSYEDFLQGLEIQVGIFRYSKIIAGRISQLTQRTNQFNFTGRKYTVKELKDAEYVFCIRYRDKVGDQGIVGAAVLNDGKLEAFVMSCRILGRGVEDLFFKLICDKYDPEINLVDTGKNKAAQDFINREKEVATWITVACSEL